MAYHKETTLFTIAGKQAVQIPYFRTNSVYSYKFRIFVQIPFIRTNSVQILIQCKVFFCF